MGRAAKKVGALTWTSTPIYQNQRSCYLDLLGIAAAAAMMDAHKVWCSKRDWMKNGQDEVSSYTALFRVARSQDKIMFRSYLRMTAELFHHSVESKTCN